MFFSQRPNQLRRNRDASIGSSILVTPLRSLRASAAVRSLLVVFALTGLALIGAVPPPAGPSVNDQAGGRSASRQDDANCGYAGIGDVAAGRYLGQIHLQMKASGQLAGSPATMEVTTNIDGQEGEKSLEIVVTYDEGSSSPKYSGRASVGGGTAIKLSGPRSADISGDAPDTKFVLNVSDSDSGDIRLEGEMPGGSPFTATVTIPGLGSATRTKAQQSGAVAFDLVIDEFDCGKISGNFNENSGIIAGMKSAYAPLGLKIEVIGTWDATLEEKGESLEAEVEEAMGKARAGSQKSILELIEFAGRLQKEGGDHSYEACLAERLLEKASELARERLRRAFESWTRSLGFDSANGASDTSQPVLMAARRVVRSGLSEAQNGLITDCPEWQDAKDLVRDVVGGILEKVLERWEKGEASFAELVGATAEAMGWGVESDASSDAQAEINEVLNS